ncbi:GNAT family N-acetyltransferase [Aquisalimonas lutea]|uniref:GNAT family N-acetyltransferase n=1 Tax=Aquisalimonas lutea TaxID=1327750 RepID=UPI0025B57F8F|nr:GNAT family N-acetyltransferase [Aquisalimonas lutea]MDN3519132.1 GNAT family N-acetyltransferase [Aquisalimonas lutea]
MTAETRIADTRDAADIARVHVASWRAAYRGILPDDLLDRLTVADREALWQQVLSDDRVQVAVVEENAAVRGFLSVGPSRDAGAGKDTGEVSAIYLDPDVWRRGHGSLLMDRAVQMARSNGWSQLTVWVLRENTGARAFYEHMGFGPDGAEREEMVQSTKVTEVRYARRTDA